VKALPEGHRRAITVRDVSDGGLRLELAAGELALGDELGVELPAQRGLPRIVGLAKVRWTDGRRAGLSLDAMFPHHRWRFERIVLAEAAREGARGAAR
jgi:hypothetical protein